MKIAFMTFACPEWDLGQVLACAAELGYDGIEPRMDSKHQHGIEVDLDAAGRAEVKRRAADAGVELCCLATSLQFQKTDDAAKAELLEQAKERIALAAELGMAGLRVFAGQRAEGVSREDGLKACGENLAVAGDLARDAGVVLWLETHDSVSKAVDCAEAVRHAAHPAVLVNYDVMHPYRNGESLAETFAALEGLIGHTHWHDAIAEPGRPEITRFGEGQLPLIEMLTGLKQRGFTGYLSGEWFGEQLGASPRESLEHYISATRELLAQI